MYSSPGFRRRQNKAITAGIAVLLCAAAAFVVVFYPFGADAPLEDEVLPVEDTPFSIPKASKAARWDYLLPMIRSPHTRQIPPHIRHRELQHAASIRGDAAFAGKSGAAEAEWFEVGPSDVGGRTRALAIDVDDPDRILAGGVSGGLWESTNAGSSWSPLNLDGGNLSVTYLAQDPRPGQTDVWYYASGEFRGNTASALGGSAPYFGSGVYKSTDDARTWSLLPAADPANLIAFDSPFDFVSRIVISPVTGSLFLASNAIGIYRSTDGGQSFGPTPAPFPEPVLGGVNDHDWADVAVNREGVLLATLSSVGSNDTPDNAPGVYVSVDDGVSWLDITPNTFPNTHGRSVIAFAESDPDIAYIYTTTLTTVNDREDVRLHRIDLSTGQSRNLSSNIPRLSEVGNLNTQLAYNMSLAVKPDDEDFVVLGGTNLYRSRNGFSRANVDRLDYWIGGYSAVEDAFVNYDNHHPDQHILLFDPLDPDRLWTGNDGGVYRTDDITRQGVVTWSDLNQGYNITQFYSVGLSDESGDLRIAGGAQDNGTPFLRIDDLAAGSRNINAGDGTQLYFGDEFAYVGQQQGGLLRLTYNASGAPTFSGFSFIQPRSAGGQLFVAPFQVDPNDEDVMYYAAGADLWRNDRLSTLRGGQTDIDGSDEGWTELTGLPFLGPRVITALAISSRPAHVLYYAASDRRAENPLPPQLYRLENAPTGRGNNATSISIPGAVDGSYVADIAVNPFDADEFLVVLSNYEIVGVYHSKNGGASYAAVEGNLIGNPAIPGPSIRSAAILPGPDGARYYLGTSTGLYSTMTLDGLSTTWAPEGAGVIGQSVVWDLTSRPSDQLVAAATHGRGLFVGSLDPDFVVTPISETFELAQNYPNPFASTTRILFDLPTRSRVSISVFDLSGRKIADLALDQERETGRHEVVFNAASISSGVYLYRLEANPIETTDGLSSFTRTRKMMIVK